MANGAEPVWGQPVDGLRAAVEFRSTLSTPQAVRDNAAGTFPLGSQVVADLLVQNVSDHNITFWSETWRQDDRMFQIDETGKETELHHSWYSGWPRMNHWELKPQQIAVLPAIGPAIGAKLATMNNFQHPIGPMIGGMPGTYSLRYELRFGGMQRTDKDGKTVIPGEGDWKGTLSTGIAKLEARDRIPADDPPTFSGRLEIRDADGEPVSRGFVRASQPSGKPLFEGVVPSATVEIPGCTDAALNVYVRAPGYEEAQFYDVAPKLNQKTTLTVKRAEPTHLKLLSAEGDPVVGAKVHHFVTSKMDASAGPYPTAGIHGEIWAASNADGEVVLDSLQKIDPHEAKLGNNIYWFYIEPPEFAPQFIGPLQAGQDLGTIRVGPLLEASGQIVGTPEELKAFQAEWDQPEPMKRGDGTVGWEFAESQRLETTRVGDVLTFHLTGLRPGTLRIVSLPARRQTDQPHVLPPRAE